MKFNPTHLKIKRILQKRKPENVLIRKALQTSKYVTAPPKARERLRRIKKRQIKVVFVCWTGQGSSLREMEGFKRMVKQKRLNKKFVVNTVGFRDFAYKDLYYKRPEALKLIREADVVVSWDDVLKTAELNPQMETKRYLKNKDVIMVSKSFDEIRKANNMDEVFREMGGEAFQKIIKKRII